MADLATNSLFHAAPGNHYRHEAIEPGIVSRRRVKHGDELFEILGIQTETRLTENHLLRSVAGCFKHEVRTVLAHVRYRDGKIFVRWVMTHREYDDWCKLYRKGKV